MGSRIAVMKDGILQQVDTPQKLYDDPDNVFVAGFIGSPAMNFFDATLVSEDDKLFIDTGVFRIQVPPHKVATYKPHAGHPVVFGIRPEDIHDPEFRPTNITEARIEAEVDVTELMGNEVFVYYNVGGKSFVGRVDPRTTAHVGEKMPAVINLENMRIFDRKTERQIR